MGAIRASGVDHTRVPYHGRFPVALCLSEQCQKCTSRDEKMLIVQTFIPTSSPPLYDAGAHLHAAGSGYDAGACARRVQGKPHGILLTPDANLPAASCASVEMEARSSLRNMCVNLRLCIFQFWQLPKRVFG